MKKVLFATSALVASASFAHADVAISGDGRMGIVNNEYAVAFGTPTEETALSSRIRIAFTASGTTDNGLDFGGSVRAEQDGSGGAAGTVYISGEFGKLSMGDTSSAAENAVGDLAGVGYTGIGAFGYGIALAEGGGWEYTTDTTASGYRGITLGNETIFYASGDNPSALYSYTAGGMTFHASIGQMSDDVESVSVAGSFDAGPATFALGYESINNVLDTTSGSVTYGLGATTVKGMYAVTDFDDTSVELTQAGASATYAAAGGLSFDAFVKRNELDSGTGTADVDSMGVGVTQTLGGGAAIEAGYANIDMKELGARSYDVFDIGLTFSF